MTPFKKEKLLRELVIRATRSSGKGGQHVNKVSTKIEIRFNIHTSQVLNEDEKKIIFKKLKTKITDDGEIILTSQEGRSQWMNKESAKEKFLVLIEKSLVPQKKRIASKPSAGAKQKRLKDKKSVSEKKQNRSAKIISSTD